MPTSISKKTQRIIWLVLAGALLVLFLQWAIPALIAYGVFNLVKAIIAMIIFAALIAIIGCIVGAFCLILLAYFHWLFYDKS